MAGLIPLRLPTVTGSPPAAGHRASIAELPTYSISSSARPARHARHASLGSLAIPVRAPRAIQRVSSPMLALLPNLPYTAAEWRRTMAEIKRHHVSKRFRACSARCTEILDNLKETSSVEPAHLIYLHFYAANSFEMCARPYPATAPARIQLLTQARTHYDEAAALIKAAETAAVSLSRSSSRASVAFSGSGFHSPSGSISSGTWSTPSTASPTNSICSYEDLLSRSSDSTPVQRKAKKTVSFQLPKEEKFTFPTEPIIRPDSPTLGFEDAYFASPILRSPLPEPPKRPASPESASASSPDLHAPMPRRSSMRHSLSSQNGFDQFDEDSLRASQSVYRYCDTLMSLKYQLQAHRSDVDTLLGESTGQTRKEEFIAAIVSNPNASVASEELRMLDRQARIEKLRQNGWQRKRFDASRYERLCNDVLAELS
ncbi:hypothetical protein PgNI_06319 [Pyricularia grisea]|uniref:Uncharacterized protein n=1 Tax=Pyricularia grisea TaxID=148305 RepID=A0A6P8B672_PYRGI|nr:hypothetical protein PgNI_06319 [Pyricularia grisea]TLD10755.1 hypothetical protein PgNI_06319 [Pyricularia grisea]